MIATFRATRWLVPTLLLLALAAACNDSDEAPENPGSPLYIALGDSLSVGVGASDPGATGFVPLVHESLGEEFELLNLGRSGATSQDLLELGDLDRALDQIERRNADGDNDVRLVTLEIGGNDLLRLYFSLVQTRICPDLQASLEKDECVDALDSALRNYEPNLGTALDRLQQADPSLRIVLLTLYTPFSGLLPVIAEVGDLALEGRPDSRFPEGLNDIIRAQASQRQLVLVDLHPLFEGRAPELISDDLIHPNDQGYRVMADAVIEVLEDLR